jgi:hypothetical protein
MLQKEIERAVQASKEGFISKHVHRLVKLINDASNIRHKRRLHGEKKA